MTGRRARSPGKIRRLAQLSTHEGIFVILAADHRDSLRAVLAPEDPESVTPSTMTQIKLELLEALAHETTGVMLEPEFSAAQAIGSRALPGDVGFLCALEAQGYLGDPEARETSLMDGWSVEKAVRLGASGIKLLVLYRPDAGQVAELQDQLISAVVAECERYDVPLFLEPFGYALEPGLSTDSTEYATKRRSIVVESVRRLGALEPDVLKVQFPVDTRHEEDRGVWRDACAELDAVSAVPWALLSGGDPYAMFREQLQVACRAGASGFMVGRALWSEAVTLPPHERDELIETDVRPRFRDLAAIAREEGRDWAARYALPDADETWYLTY